MEHASESLSEYAGTQQSHNDVMGKCCIAKYNYVVFQMSAHFHVQVAQRMGKYSATEDNRAYFQTEKKKEKEGREKKRVTA